MRARDLAPKGAGLRILTETVTSPTLGAQIQSLLAQYPGAKWHQYEPCSGDSVREGTRLAFGKPVNPVYHFDQADVIVSLDADFLTSGPGHVRYTRDFSSRRDLGGRAFVEAEPPLCRREHADEHRSDGGSSACRCARREVEAFARQLAAAVGVSVAAPA